MGAGAALDVLTQEPPDRHDPILQFENVLILPHVASGTTETRRAMAELAVENLLACVHGDPCACIVNPLDAGARA
jgi:lactate dehydrogenase-like 2-hydroxyacid dehydrogenase